jgi:outer membrane protein assembly factor BamB
VIYVRDPSTGDVQRRLLLKNCERPKLAFAQDNTLYVTTYNYSISKALLIALDFETGTTNWISDATDGGRLNVGTTAPSTPPLAMKVYMRFTVPAHWQIPPGRRRDKMHRTPVTGKFPARRESQGNRETSGLP